MSTASRQVVDILGVDVDTDTLDDLHAAIRDAITQKRRVTFLNVNVHALNLACDRPSFRAILNRADKVFCDGKGVQYAARYLGHVLPARITYADWIWQLAEFAVNHNFSFYFLGGREGVAAEAAHCLRARWPTLRIRDCHHGYFDKAVDSQANQEVVAAINQADPDILIVAFGMPLQEEWLHANRTALTTRVALTGGAVFDYVSGNLRRGPAWMTQHGWEWLARLLIEPGRLWRRYLLGNPLFVARILRQRWANRK